MTPDLEEIVVSGAQGGNVSRRIRMIDLRAVVHAVRPDSSDRGTTDTADESILRTDYGAATGTG